MKKLYAILLVFTMILTACGTSEETKKEVSNYSKIAIDDTNEGKIKSSLIQNATEYDGLEYQEIKVNDNLGTEDVKDDYVVIVNADYTTEHSPETADKFSKKYADDMVARLAKDTDKVKEISVLIKDVYNKKDLSYKYDFENGGFYLRK